MSGIANVASVLQEVFGNNYSYLILPGKDIDLPYAVHRLVGETIAVALNGAAVQEQSLQVEYFSQDVGEIIDRDAKVMNMLQREGVLASFSGARDEAFEHPDTGDVIIRRTRTLAVL